MKTKHQAGKKGNHSKAHSQAAFMRHQRRMERIDKAIEGATQAELRKGQEDDLRKLQRFVSKYYRLVDGNEEPMMDLAWRMFHRFSVTASRLNACKKGGAQ